MFVQLIQNHYKTSNVIWKSLSTVSIKKTLSYSFNRISGFYLDQIVATWNFTVDSVWKQTLQERTLRRGEKWYAQVKLNFTISILESGPKNCQPTTTLGWASHSTSTEWARDYVM